MSDLKMRLLSTVENHGKSDIHGIFILYPRERKFSIYRNLLVLKNEGWIKVRKTRMLDGVKIPSPNVSRTNKQMYSQPELFNQDSL